MSNPVIEREWIGLLRTRLGGDNAGRGGRGVYFTRAFTMALGRSGGLERGAGARGFSVLRLRPVDCSHLTRARFSRHVDRGRERIRGTLALLLHSPLRPWSIYLGKLLGVLGFAYLLLLASVPAAAACYAMVVI